MNAADVLATLQVMQDFGVNLICVEDGIDSSKDAGKLMISVLSAVQRVNVRTFVFRQWKAGCRKPGKVNGIHKIARQNGKNPLFDAALIRRIIQNRFIAVKFPMAEDGQKRFMVQGTSTGRLRKTIICW